MIKLRAANGSGPGYCYVWGNSHLFVCSDDLSTARLCCAGRMRLKRTLSYRPNPHRKVYVFSVR